MLKKILVSLSFYLCFIFIGMHGYCQNPSDSVKYLAIEKTFEKDGKIKIRLKQFPEHPKIKVYLNDSTIIKGKISEITDTTITVRNGVTFKIIKVKEIAIQGPTFLEISGGILVFAGVLLIGHSFSLVYRDGLFEGLAIFFPGAILGNLGLILRECKKRYTISEKIKIKVITKLRPIF